MTQTWITSVSGQKKPGNIICSDKAEIDFFEVLKGGEEWLDCYVYLQRAENENIMYSYYSWYFLFTPSRLNEVYIHNILKVKNK